jgi:hypothetical protein
MHVRCAELLDLARGAPCLVNIAGVCNNNSATTVAAHSNELRHGHGVGIKAHDVFIAFACSACHDVIDGRSMNKFSAAQRREFWRTGFERTLRHLWATGKVGVLQPILRASRASRPMRRPARLKNSPTARPAKMLPRRLG